MRRNIVVDIDAYKATHPLIINQGLTRQYAYGEARKGAKYPKVCFVGMDPIIKDNFLTVPTNADLEEAREEMVSTFGYDVFRMKNNAGLSSEDVWKKVQKLGHIPVEIKAVPEGSIVPVDNVLFTTESTQPWFAKHANGLETLMMHVWYPTMVSTRFKYIKENLRPLVEQSGTPEILDFMINDFGARGASSYESAFYGGLGVLVHGQGSDNMIASRLIKDYYGYQGRAKSIVASEHSVALSFSSGDGEYNYVKHMLDTVPLNKMLAIVIDTYDSRNFMYNVVGREDIKKRIKERSKAGGRTIFRPDSGIPEEQIDMVFDALTAHFGYTLNSKGYKVFNHSVGAIQGDGMNEYTIIELYKYIIKNRFSSDNLATGSGGGLLQVDANRDILRFAIKPAQGDIDGKTINFEKNPASDTTKKSKSGILKLHPGINGNFQTLSSVNESSEAFRGFVDALQVVYRNGVHQSDNHFLKVVERASVRL